MTNYHEIYYTGNEIKYIENAMHNKVLHGNGEFCTRACKKLEDIIGGQAMLMPSCTSALEMIALLLDIKSADEIIMPSYTFVSTANAFALRGGKIKFVDVDPLTMNISIEGIKAAITEQTKAVVVVNYGGFSVDFDELIPLLNRKDIYLIEDNAQGIGAYYKEKALGSFGDFSCISFHDTKNVTAGGEGGALIINNEKFWNKARIIQEKGTNRFDFINKKVDHYSWQDLGSSYLMSEINAAFLFAQLEVLETITNDRRELWEIYYKGLEALENEGVLMRQKKCTENRNNGHLFFIRLKGKGQLKALKKYLAKEDIITKTHYVALHSSKAGKKYGEFIGADEFTSKESQRLLRLPLHNNLTAAAVDCVIKRINRFFKEKCHE